MTQADLTYPNAPIVQAVLDIRVDTDEAFDVERLRDIGGEIGGNYAPPTEQFQHSIHLDGLDKAEVPLPQRSKLTMGFAGNDVTAGRAYQALKSGLVVSKLAPYIDWKDLKQEAIRIWPIYSKIVRPSRVTRVGLRYINQININMPTVDLEDYFYTTLRVCPGIESGISGFYFQVQMPQPDIKAGCIINSAGVPPVAEGVTSVVLDIDLFRTESVPQSADLMWDLFDKLRERKNSIFEASITDKTRELFR